MAEPLGTAFVEIKGDYSSLMEQTSAFFAGSKWKAASAKAAVGVAAVGTAAAVVGKALYDVGEEFDAAADKIRTRTGATGKELAKLEKSFKRVVSSVPADFGSASEAVAGLNQRLDITGRPLQRLSKQLLELSRITETDVGDNVRTVTRLFGDWSVATKQQGKTLDGLFRLSQETGIAVSELADTMVQFGSPLRTLGLDFDFAAAMIAKFEREGVNMTTLMSGLRLSVANLSDPTDELAASFKKFGITAREPAQAVFQVMEAIKQTASVTKGNTLAFEVFGRRAGSDMAAAIREGRFSLDDLMAAMKSGGETIRGAGRDTRDFAEEWQVFTNRLKVFVEPVATAVFKAVGDGMKALNRLDLKSAVHSLKEFWREAGVMRDVIGRVWDAISGIFKNLVSGAKNVVKLVSSILTGNFKEAWQAVRDIFAGGVKLALLPIKAAVGLVKDIVRRIGGALGDGFEAAWDRAKAIFEGGANVVLRIVNAILDVVEEIPGVGDLGPIKLLGSGADVNPSTNSNASGPPKPDKLFSGGKVTKPTAIVGEEAPRHPEYVLATNPAYRGRNVKLWQAAGRELGIPGFAKGGVNTLDAVTGTASSYIDKLPNTDGLPGFMSGLGPWMIDKASSFIRKRVSSAVESAADVVTGGMKGHMTYPGVSGDTDFVPALGRALSEMARASGTAISVQSGRRTLAEQAALYEAYLNGTGNLAAPPNPNAPHVRGIAADITPGREAFGGVAGKYGLGFTVPSESWHIELLRRGGILGKAVEFLAGGGKRGKGNGDNRKGDVIQRPLPAALQRYNRLFAEHNSANGDWGGEKMPLNLIAMLAEFFGMPGKTMAQVTIGESGQRPGATGEDRGGTKGYGLWMITTSFNDAIANRLGGYPQLLNPIKNAIAAREAYKAAGGLSPWYGTSHVTATNAHWEGDFGKLVRADGSGGGGGGKPDKPDKPPKPDKPDVSLEVGVAKALLPRKLVKAINKLRRQTPKLTEQVDVATTLAGFASSPDGVDLSSGERTGLIGLNESLLGNLTDRARKLGRAVGLLPKSQQKSDLLAELVEIQGITANGGLILDVRSVLDDLRGSTSSGLSENASARADLLAEQLAERTRENMILRSQMPVFNRMFSRAPFGGVFHDGGTVPGPLGAERTIIARGGETVTPAGGAPVEVTLIVHDGAVNPDAIDVRINDRLATIARHSESPRGGVTGRKALYG